MTRSELSLGLLTLVSLLLLHGFVAASTSIPRARPEGDRSSRTPITTLPGYNGTLQSKHYSGFLTVDLEKKSHLFYYFVESEGQPKNDPVVLWLNGGPGCSSLDGFVYEHGPFNFDFNGGDVKLKNNPYAWSKVANMIYLDSPAGVGLSYSEGAKKYKTDDVKTSLDLLSAVLKFFELYPEFKSNRFFVSGESYAGIYVPTAVFQIVRSNARGDNPKINIIGYLVGNPVTDRLVDNGAFSPFAVGKSLMSRKLFDQITEACRGKYWDTPYGSECFNLQSRAYARLSSTLNVYNVAGKCERPPEVVAESNAEDAEQRIRSFHDVNGLVWPLGRLPASGRVHNWRTALNMEAPCSDYWTAESWLNREDVRKAIHAAPLNVSGKFLICSDRISYRKTIRSVFNLHSQLINRYGMHALVFSGDHDMAVPHTGTEEWTTMLKQPLKAEWAEWMDNENQVGGYHVEYENLTYCTIRNAGHMVPQTHPVQGLEMFRRYLSQLSMKDKPETKTAV